jgi:acyl carrier protein
VDQRVYDAAMRYRDNPRELLDPSYRAATLARESPAAATSDTVSEVRRLVAKSLSVSDDTILETSSLRDLGVNSLDLVVLVMAIEERFRIEFDPSDLERLRTFGELARRVAELKGDA